MLLLLYAILFFGSYDNEDIFFNKKKQITFSKLPKTLFVLVMLEQSNGNVLGCLFLACLFLA